MTMCMAWHGAGGMARDGARRSARARGGGYLLHKRDFGRLEREDLASSGGEGCGSARGGEGEREKGGVRALGRGEGGGAGAAAAVAVWRPRSGGECGEGAPRAALRLQKAPPTERCNTEDILNERGVGVVCVCKGV